MIPLVVGKSCGGGRKHRIHYVDVGGLKLQLAVIAAIAAAIVGVAFAMQNNIAGDRQCPALEFDSSRHGPYLLALALGAIAVALLTTPATLKWQWQRCARNVVSKNWKNLRDQRNGSPGGRIYPADAGENRRYPSRQVGLTPTIYRPGGGAANESKAVAAVKSRIRVGGLDGLRHVVFRPAAESP